MRASTRVVFTIAGLLTVGGVTIEAAVRQQPEQRSVSGLVFDLEHPEVTRRTTAARLLGENKVHRAVPALIEASDDPVEEVRHEVVRALVRIHDRRALQTYVTLTHDSGSAIQEKAIEGIINTYVGDDSGFISGLRNVVDFVNPFSDDYNPLVVESFIEVSPEAIEALADLLSTDRHDIRKAAATALGVLRARAALSAITDGLDSESSSEIKVELIRTIYKIGDPAAGRALVPQMLDSNKGVHDEAIYAAGRLRITEAVPSLIDMWRAGVEERRTIFGFIPVSGSDDLSRRVLEALAYIGDPRSDGVFLEALDADHGWSRRYGAEGLGRIGDTAHLPEIARRYLGEKSGAVKLALGYARYRLGQEEYLSDLVDAVTNGDQAYSYLMESGPDDVTRLGSYLRSESDEVKVRLLEVVGMRGGRAAVEVAEELIQSGSDDVREAANLAILRIRGRYPDA